VEGSLEEWIRWGNEMRRGEKVVVIVSLILKDGRHSLSSRKPFVVLASYFLRDS
jgi:hypothetical protein